MSQKPTLGTTIRNLINAYMETVNTTLPCVVESFDAVNMRATVIPLMLIKDPLKPENIVTPSPLLDLPVIFPDDGDIYVRNPLLPKQTVLVAFSKVAMDTLLGVSEPADPVSVRKFSMKDGFVLGSYRWDGGSETSAENTESFIIHRRSTDTTLAIDKEGNVTISNVKNFNVFAENINLEATGDCLIGGGQYTDIAGEQMYVRGTDTHIEGETLSMAATSAGTISGTFSGGDITDASGVNLGSHTHPYTDDGSPMNTGAPNK